MLSTTPSSATLRDLKNALDGKPGHESVGSLMPDLETSEANALLNDAVARARREAGACGSTYIELLIFPDATGAAVRGIDSDEVVVAVLTAEEAHDFMQQ